MRKKLIFALVLFHVCSMMAQENVLMLIGTYTNGSSKGIYSYRFNQNTGAHEVLGVLPMCTDRRKACRT